jgi:hypothetical protein
MAMKRRVESFSRQETLGCSRLKRKFREIEMELLANENHLTGKMVRNGLWIN